MKIASSANAALREHYSLSNLFSIQFIAGR